MTDPSFTGSPREVLRMFWSMRWYFAGLIVVCLALGLILRLGDALMERLL